MLRARLHGVNDQLFTGVERQDHGFQDPSAVVEAK